MGRAGREDRLEAFLHLAAGQVGIVAQREIAATIADGAAPRIPVEERQDFSFKEAAPVEAFPRDGAATAARLSELRRLHADLLLGSLLQGTAGECTAVRL